MGKTFKDEDYYDDDYGNSSQKKISKKEKKALRKKRDIVVEKPIDNGRKDDIVYKRDGDWGRR